MDVCVVDDCLLEKRGKLEHEIIHLHFPESWEITETELLLQKRGIVCRELFVSQESRLLWSHNLVLSPFLQVLLLKIGESHIPLEFAEDLGLDQFFFCSHSLNVEAFFEILSACIVVLVILEAVLHIGFVFDQAFDIELDINVAVGFILEENIET